MDDDLRLFLPRPTPERPLNGSNLLLVEDSRCAAQAMRLLAQRSGARLRRADSLAAAHRHLAAFRPKIVIVDIGLPDGNGADLIAELATADARVPVLIGTSGDPGAQEMAMEAGADGFLAKPVESLAVFQQVLIGLLPLEDVPRGPRALPDQKIAPDRGTLAQDLEQAALILRDETGAGVVYAAQFLGTLARASNDPALENAARQLAATPAQAPQVARLVTERLAEIQAAV